MILTNLHNLHPLVLKGAETFLQRPRPESMRVTEMKNPSIIKKLMMEHWDRLTQDISDLAWSMYGTSVHRMFEKLSLPGMVQGLRMETKKFGLPITGTLDVLDFNTQEIMDFKTTSVWKIVYGDYDDFIKQLNLYMYLAAGYGIKVTKLSNTLILKDWKSRDAKQDQGGKYPKSPIVSFNSPVYTLGQMESYIKTRLKAHETEQDKVCSAEDRWERVSYAVMRPGQKRAVSTHDNQQDADIACAAHYDKTVTVVKRGGNPLRCLEYCPVRGYCPFGKILDIKS